MSNNDCGNHAGFWLRFLAWVVDCVLFTALAELLTALTARFYVVDYVITLFSFFIACVALCLGIFRGHTLGKRLLRLQVVENGRDVPAGTLRWVFRETIAKFLSLIAFGFGFLWIGVSRSKRGFHDYVAGTSVIKRGSRMQAATVLGCLGLLCSLWLGKNVVEVRRLASKNTLHANAIDVEQIHDGDHQTYVTYLQKSGMPPIDYVQAKFKTHDVVIVGEPHQIKEYCQLIGSLIRPSYYASGVRVLAMEVLKYKNTPLINQLVTAKTYDEELALSLFRDCAWPDWGFQEYIDILKSVWALNGSLPANAEKFQVLGLEADWNGSCLRSGPLWQIPSTMTKILYRDEYMAHVFETEVLRKGKKALVQVGSGHDYVGYCQPKPITKTLIAEQSPRFGDLLHQKYPGKIFQIHLHQWEMTPAEAASGSNDYGSRQPLNGLLERIFKENGNTPVGFDVIHSPFAALRDNGCYLFAYQKYVTFADIAKGYIFVKPLAKLQPVTWARHFVNDKNYAVLKQLLSFNVPGIRGQNLSNDDLNDKWKSWQEERRKVTAQEEGSRPK